MSYSRWICSDYYTYWMSAKVYDKFDEIFTCHYDLERTDHLTYTECKKIIENDYPKYDAELKGYMKSFMEDVDKEYLSRCRGGM